MHRNESEDSFLIANLSKVAMAPMINIAAMSGSIYSEGIKYPITEKVRKIKQDRKIGLM